MGERDALVRDGEDVSVDAHRPRRSERERVLETHVELIASFKPSRAARLDAHNLVPFGIEEDSPLGGVAYARVDGAARSRLRVRGQQLPVARKPLLPDRLNCVVAPGRLVRVA